MDDGPSVLPSNSTSDDHDDVGGAAMEMGGGGGKLPAAAMGKHFYGTVQKHRSCILVFHVLILLCPS